jgi:hypothetical protein
MIQSQSNWGFEIVIDTPTVTVTSRIVAFIVAQKNCKAYNELSRIGV